MKIKSIETVKVNLPQRRLSVQARRDSWEKSHEVATPMSGYSHVKRHRGPMDEPTGWDRVFVKVTLEDGTWGPRLNHPRGAGCRHYQRSSGTPARGSRRLRDRKTRRYDGPADQVLRLDRSRVLCRQRD